MEYSPYSPETQEYEEQDTKSPLPFHTMKRLATQMGCTTFSQQDYEEVMTEATHMLLRLLQQVERFLQLSRSTSLSSDIITFLMRWNRSVFPKEVQVACRKEDLIFSQAAFHRWMTMCFQFGSFRPDPKCVFQHIIERWLQIKLSAAAESAHQQHAATVNWTQIFADPKWDPAHMKHHQWISENKTLRFPIPKLLVQFNSEFKVANATDHLIQKLLTLVVMHTLNEANALREWKHSKTLQEKHIRTAIHILWTGTLMQVIEREGEKVVRQYLAASHDRKSAAHKSGLIFSCRYVNTVLKDFKPLRMSKDVKVWLTFAIQHIATECLEAAIQVCKERNHVIIQPSDVIQGIQQDAELNWFWLNITNM